MFEKTHEWVLEPSRRRTIRRIIVVLIIIILLVGLWLMDIDEKQMEQREKQYHSQTKNGQRP